MKKILVFAILFFSSAALCLAQVNPEDLKAQAFTKIKVANELAKKGEDLLMQKHTKENITTAFQMYLQAGQLFEESGNTLKGLGKKYAKQTDIDNCYKAAEFCAQTMEKIKDSLGIK